MSGDSPAVILYDGYGNRAGVADNPIIIDPSGTTTQPTKLFSSVGTIISINADGYAQTTLLAPNKLRLGATVYNDSSAHLYLSFGSIATTSNFTVILISGAYYEVPFGYTGIITAIWDSSTGFARVTELT